MRLTEDERILMMLYGDGTRDGMIEALREIQLVLQEDEEELFRMTDGLLSKLRSMTDREFEEAAEKEFDEELKEETADKDFREGGGE